MKIDTTTPSLDLDKVIIPAEGNFCPVCQNHMSGAVVLLSPAFHRFIIFRDFFAQTRQLVRGGGPDGGHSPRVRGGGADGGRSPRFLCADCSLCRSSLLRRTCSRRIVGTGCIICLPRSFVAEGNDLLQESADPGTGRNIPARFFLGFLGCFHTGGEIALNRP